MSHALAWAYSPGTWMTSQVTANPETSSERRLMIDDMVAMADKRQSR